MPPDEKLARKLFSTHYPKKRWASYSEVHADWLKLAQVAREFVIAAHVAATRKFIREMLAVDPPEKKRRHVQR